MGKKRGFIDRSKATTFQLVHRSHRDPEYHNDEASSRVLVARDNPNHPSSATPTDTSVHDNGRQNVQTGTDLAKEFASTTRSNVGEAAEHGIYYDDTSYDYMQHLRPTGNAGAVMLENPVLQKARLKAERKDKAVQFDLTDVLPVESIASGVERPRNYEDQQEVQDSVTGFRPDLDPRIREVLMALEADEEAAAEADSEDWFAELAGSGVTDELSQGGGGGGDGDGCGNYDEDYGYDTDDTANAVTTNTTRPASATVKSQRGNNQSTSGSEWEQEFAKFKRAGAKMVDETGSQVSRAFTSASEGRVKWGNGSIGTGFSMSSSALYRNEGLTLLDDRFDRIEREYIPEEDEDDLDNEDGITSHHVNPSHSTGGGGSKYEPRQDFDSIMDEFLEEHKNMGQKGATRKARNPYTLDDARIALGNVKLGK